MEIGKLIPVEAVAVRQDGEWIRIQIDTGDYGVGYTVEEAYMDLRETAIGTVYLDTAKWLVLDRQTVNMIKGINGYLKRDVRVCINENADNLEEIAVYLNAHKPTVSIRHMETGISPQVLEKESDGYRLK